MGDDFDIRRQSNQKEKDFENALRPLSFDDFCGQQKVVDNLKIFVEAAKFRGEPLDHTLLQSHNYLYTHYNYTPLHRTYMKFPHLEQ